MIIRYRIFQRSGERLLTYYSAKCGRTVLSSGYNIVFHKLIYFQCKYSHFRRKYSITNATIFQTKMIIFAFLKRLDNGNQIHTRKH